MIKSHDGEIHIARLASFYSSFSQGNLIPRWGANLNKGYGHPTLMFLYPLPNYLGVFFYNLGFSFTDSVKILFILGYVLSGIFFFLFLRKLFGSFPSFFGTLVFLFTPYRFVDMFVRGALPEHLFFTFAAISLFLFLFFLEKPNQKRYILLSITLASLVLVHNASALLFYPFLFILGLIIAYYIFQKKLSLKVLLLLLAPFISAIILTSFHWIPALVEGKYTLRHLISTKEFTISHLVNLKKLIVPNWGYGDPRYENGLSTQIGLINLLFFILLILFLKKTKKILNIYLLTIFVILVFLMTIYSKPIWLSNNILFNIRFPWRLLVLLTFISGIITSSVVSITNTRNLKIKEKIFIISLFFLVINVLTLSYQKPSGYLQKSDYYYLNEYNGTGDTGESSPIWSTINSRYERKPPFEVISGKVDIKKVEKQSEKQSVNINIASDKAHILSNTLYFPGWTVYDNNIDITSQIEFQDPAYRGLMTFWLNRGDHEIVLLFKNTKVRQFSTIISLFGLVFFFFPISKLTTK